MSDDDDLIEAGTVVKTWFPLTDEIQEEFNSAAPPEPTSVPPSTSRQFTIPPTRSETRPTAHPVGSTQGRTILGQSGTGVRPISEPQKDYIEVLLNLVSTRHPDTYQVARKWYDEKRDSLDTKGAHKLIERLKDYAYRRPPVDSAPASTIPSEPQNRETVEDGMYLFNGEVWKVVHAVHASGHQYAKRFVPPAYEGAKGTFEFVRGAIKRLRPEHRMSLEQAVHYGKLYGVCIRCGTVLTDETSIEEAMGPVCRTKI